MDMKVLEIIASVAADPPGIGRDGPVVGAAAAHNIIEALGAAGYVVMAKSEIPAPLPVYNTPME